MPTLRLNDSIVKLRLPVGDAVTVTAPPGSSAYITQDDVIGSTVTGATQVFGPYTVVKVIALRCTAGAVSWTQASAPLGALYDPSTGVLAAASLQTLTVATLPAASAALKGSRAFVSDATSPTFQATVSGGGAVYTPVYCDGSAWKVG